MYGLELAQGCPPAGKADGCYGSIGPYWKFWGYGLQYQSFAFIASSILATAIAIFGYFRKWNRAVLCIIVLATFLYGLSTYVIFNPMIMLY